MLKIKVTKLDKNGKIQKYTMKLRNTNSNNLLNIYFISQKSPILIS